MNDTCRDVLDQIELFAAGECNERERAIISRHLAVCPACARSEREAALLLGLLDAHFEEPERLRRLHARLESEWRAAPRRRLLAFVRRATAVAAMLLLAFGLTLGFRAFSPADVEAPLEIAVGRASSRLAHPAPAIDPAVPEKLLALAEPLVYTLDMKGLTAAEYRHQLKESISQGRPPAPPRVNLELKLRNRGQRELRILVGAEQSELSLSLAGPGVLIVPAKDALNAAFLMPRTVRLAPGQATSLPIEQLVLGKRESIQYAYWTEPGEYVLSIRYRAVVALNGADARQIAQENATVKIQVAAAK